MKPTYEELLIALREATEVLEILRRCHGTDVSNACYPALNNCRDILDRVNHA